MFEDDIDDDTAIEEHDYAHCACCDLVIDLDTDSWSADDNNTYCDFCS